MRTAQKDRFESFKLTWRTRLSLKSALVCATEAKATHELLRDTYFLHVFLLYIFSIITSQTNIFHSQQKEEEKQSPVEEKKNLAELRVEHDGECKKEKHIERVNLS